MKAACRLLGLAVFGTLFFLLFPYWIIQPFRAQGARELAAALVVIRWAPLATGLFAAIAIAAAAIIWPASRWNVRMFVGAGALLAVAAAFLSHVNVFEKMFHPVGAPSFVAASEAGVTADDMVLAVAENRNSHAYPIREMGYHHVVNDWLGTVPIVATY